MLRAPVLDAGGHVEGEPGVEVGRFVRPHTLPRYPLESIAHPEGGDSGFHLTPEELVAWKRSDPSCQGNLRPDRPLGQRAQQVRRRFQQPGYNPIGMAG